MQRHASTVLVVVTIISAIAALVVNAISASKGSWMDSAC